MDINRKTALKMWDQRIGKSISKATDFTGRIIYKGSYGNSNLINGWNIDHILPISKGGTDDINNLQIVHILTNKEKGNNYPDFKANDNEWKDIGKNGKHEIVLVNKKEISEDIKLVTAKENTKTPKVVEKTKVNVDSKTEAKKQTNDDTITNNISLTLKHIKELDANKNNKRYTGSILIRLKNLKNEALIKFIKEDFNEEDLIFFNTGKVTNILIRKYDISLKKDNKYLMDKCILINTYLKNYFLKKDYFKSYDIHYEITKLDDINLDRVIHKESKLLNTMYFNDLVVSNMLSNEVIDISNINVNHFDTYDLEIKSLKEELFKEVNKMD